jgi:hypothetical protein
LEHVGIEKGEQLFGDVFRAVGASFAGALDRERLSGTFVRISAARGHVARETVQKSQN